MRQLAILSLVLAFAIAGCKKSDEKKPEGGKTTTPTKPDVKPEVKPDTPDTPDTPDAPDTGGYTLTAPADLEWGPLDPSNDKGPELAVVHGNPQEDGLSALFLRIPAKGDAGIHSHTAGYRALVVSGNAKHWLPGDKKVKALAPGSYWNQPGGQAHGDSCDGPEPCILFIVLDGKFDFIPKPDVKKAEANAAYTLTRAENAKFAPFDPKAKDGPHLAMLDGDPKTGPIAFSGKFPAGGSPGLHSHTSDYHAVVISGAPSHWIDGGEGKDEALATGTHWYQPGGQVHGDACGGDSECNVFIFMPKALDFIPKPE